MEIRLSCLWCRTEWKVERWSPSAMRCPACGSAELGDELSFQEEAKRAAKRKAAKANRGGLPLKVP
jgi:hypothetical protein